MTRAALAIFAIGMSVAAWPSRSEACNTPVDLRKLLHDCPIVAVGTATVVEPDNRVADGECVWFLPIDFIKGAVRQGMKRMCYEMRLRRTAGMASAQPGERVIVFAREEAGEELLPWRTFESVVSPSNVQCALDDWYTFEGVEETLRRGALYLAGNEATRQAIALEFAKAGRPEMLGFLLGEVGQASMASRAVAFDPEAVIPPLLTIARRTDDQAAVVAFGLVESLERTVGSGNRFVNELMDTALEVMSGENVTLRDVAFRWARWETCPRPSGMRQRSPDAGAVPPECDLGPAPFQEFPRYPWPTRMCRQFYTPVHPCGEDFGYDPDAPAEERAQALSRWREWWRANRGKGRYDRSPERLAEEERRGAEGKRASERATISAGRNLALSIQAGTRILDPSSPFYRDDLMLLALAGYEVTADGRVVPLGSLADGGPPADGGADAAQPDGGTEVGGSAADGPGGEAGPEPDAIAGEDGEKRRGCGCRVPASLGGIEAVFLLSVAWLAARATARRRHR